jgi:exodeoxyribonuclease VII small subunit
VEALENVVQSLEMGDTTLERSLELFEQGVRLARRCNGLLNSAEGRIEKLVQESDGNLRAEALDSGGEPG